MSLTKAILLDAKPDRQVRRLAAFKQNWRVCARRGLVGWLTAILLANCVSILAADGPVIEEYQLKSAFLSKLPLFVQWPTQPRPNEPKEGSVGVLGQNPFGLHLETAVRSQKFGERTFSVKYCATAGEAQMCQMVFITTSEAKRLPQILNQLPKSGVLITSDIPGFAKAGGAIGLVTENKKIRLEINPDAARQAGFHIDPQLLKLARLVKTETPKSTPGA